MGSAPIKVNHIDSRVVHGPSKPSYNRIDSQWTLFLAVPLCETDTPTDTPPLTLPCPVTRTFTQHWKEMVFLKKNTLTDTAHSQLFSGPFSLPKQNIS